MWHNTPQMPKSYILTLTLLVLNRIMQVTVGINADAKDALSALITLVDESAHRLWSERFDRCNHQERILVKNPERNHRGKLTMGEVIDCVSKATKGQAIAVTDVGQNQMMSARYYKFALPKSIVTSGGLGTMGFGLPAAIGAKIAEPGRTVCMFCGDGGFQMTIQELGTIMQYGINVKIVILNNNFLGNVRQWQHLFYHDRFSQTPLLNPDFCAIASAYGIQAENVTDREELPAAVERMLRSDSAYLLNVHVDECDNVFPMIPPGGSINRIMLNRDTYFEENTIV